MAFQDERRSPRFLIHDRDSKYTAPFGEVFHTEGVESILTPFRAPRANAFAERWVRTVRAECLDWTLILSRRHLERVLQTYMVHYNAARPHGGLDLGTPEPSRQAQSQPKRRAELRRRDILGGLIHEYEAAA